MSDIKTTIKLLLCAAMLVVIGFIFGRTYVIVRSEAYVTDRNVVVMALDGYDYHYLVDAQ